MLLLEVGGDGNGKRSSVVGSVFGPGEIYPLDVFTLDTFVFSQSGWPKRLEVTCPGERRRGGGQERRGGERRRVMGGALGFWLWVVGCGLGKWFGRACRGMLIWMFGVRHARV